MKEKQTLIYNIIMLGDVMFSVYCFSGISSLDRIGCGVGTFKKVLFYSAGFSCLSFHDE